MKSSWIYFSIPSWSLQNGTKLEENVHEPICPFLSIFDWYFLIRKDAEQLLRCDGDFLVRESQQPGQFVLTGMQVTAASDWLIPDNTGLWLASADNTDILLVHRAAGRSIYFLWIPRGWSGEKLCTSPNVLYIIFAGLMKFLLNISLSINYCLQDPGPNIRECDSPDRLSQKQ